MTRTPLGSPLSPRTPGSNLIGLMLLTALTLGGIAPMASAATPEWVSQHVEWNRQWALAAFAESPEQPAEGLSAATTLPFSFTYGGRHSSEFLDSWSCAVADEPMENDTLRRTLTLTDPHTGLEVKAVVSIYGDTPGVDWTLYFTNTGGADSPILENVKALDVTIAPGLERAPGPEHTPVLHRMKGVWSRPYVEYTPEDFMPWDDPMHPGRLIEFGPPVSLSSQVDAPFFNVDWLHGGLITAIGWTGRWGAEAKYEEIGGNVTLKAGMKEMRLKLHPGETIRTPRILVVHWKGDDHLRSYNLLRRTMFAHVLPRTNGNLVLPPIAHGTNIFIKQNESTAEDILQLLDTVDDLGFEFLWVDAYYTRGGWPEGVGNYGYPLDVLWDAERYPGGLKPLGDAAHARNMGFLVWFAPERALPGTYIYEKHPEYLILLKEGEAGLYNLANPEAEAYMTEYLLTAIREFGLDCIRFDCGAWIDYLRHQDAQEPDRTGITEIRYHEALYRMWDTILATYPNVFIDNCAGGGTRVDLETCARSLPLWRTDCPGWPLAVWTPRDRDEAALQNQVSSSGLNRYMPLSTGGCMGTSPYHIRSAFNAGLIFTEDTRVPDYPLDELGKAVAEGKRIRKYFLGDYYPLSEVTTSPEDWCVMQYHRPEEQDGIILAFRRDESPYGNFTASLYDIVPEATYEVTCYSTYEPGETVTLDGASLEKLTLEIDEQPGSLLIEYRRREAGAPE